MICDICTLDAAYYGQRLHMFEDAVCCVGCFLEMHDSSFDDADMRKLPLTMQWLALPLVTPVPADFLH